MKKQTRRTPRNASRTPNTTRTPKTRRKPTAAVNQILSEAATTLAEFKESLGDDPADGFHTIVDEVGAVLTAAGRWLAAVSLSRELPARGVKGAVDLAMRRTLVSALDSVGFEGGVILQFIYDAEAAAYSEFVREFWEDTAITEKAS